MNRCSKCKNELVAEARFCNICGTPQNPSSISTSPLPEPERTIVPVVRRISIPAAQKSLPPVAIPKTTIEFTSIKSSTNGTAPGADRPSGPETPTSEAGPQKQSPAKNEEAHMPAAQQPATAPLQPPSKPGTSVPIRQQEKPAATAPLQPAGNPATRVPGIIRPIVTSSSIRQNSSAAPTLISKSPVQQISLTGKLPGQTQSPVSKPPAQRIPKPIPPVFDPVHMAIARPPSTPLTPPAAALTPHMPQTARQPEYARTAPLQPEHAVRPMPGWLPDTPSPVPPNVQQRYNGNQQVMQNGAMPLFSPESLAYTSKAAEHWRNSWKDRQYAEAGPAEGVSRGQASVPTPLLAMQNSFVRMRAVVFKQKQDTRKVSFGSWVTILLMICLVAGLGAYIIYSYLPNISGNATHLSQPAAGQSPALSITGTTSTIFKIGQSLHIAGSHFGPHDTITFLLDTTIPINSADGKPLNAQADAQGAFEVTIPINHDWPTGDRIIQAVDSAAQLSSYLNIQIIPAAKPVTSSPNLNIALNGQLIEALPFAKQIGQPDPAAQRITITNTSGAVLNWTATVTTSWLMIEDNVSTGQLAIAQPQSIGIGVNTTGLGISPPNQPYKGQILFTINNTEVLTLPVQLTITDAIPELVFSPIPIYATKNPDGSCQDGVTLTLINLGSIAMVWTVNPDLNNIKLVDSQGKQSGNLTPSGTASDTVVLTLRCTGVKRGQPYHISIYGNSNQASDTVFVQ